MSALSCGDTKHLDASDSIFRQSGIGSMAQLYYWQLVDLRTSDG